MSRWKLVRLKFRRNVTHFGELGIGLEETSERVHSDTLFSAWLSAYARLCSSIEIESLIDKCKQLTPLFRLSSTFIYQEINGQLIEYLPRPLKFPKNYPTDDDFAFTKTFKKLKYLPLSVWQRWYQGEGFTEADRNELIARTKGSSAGVLTEAGTFDYSKAYQIQKLPKVAIDRTTRATNFYHTGVVSYRWDLVNGDIESQSGLYFLVEFPTEDTEFDRTFFAVLDFLGSEGIGGERSSGAGQFEAEAVDLNATWKAVTQFADGTQYSLFSLLWQSQITPAMLHQASYELQQRGGWITSLASGGQQRRRTVQMFAEGSVLQFQPVGELADVTPPNFHAHRVYRSGICLSLPIAV
jgi:CRISPR-associated protein Csm4